MGGRSGGTVLALALALGALLLWGCSSQISYWDVGSVQAHGPDTVELPYKEGGGARAAKREQLLRLRRVVHDLAVAAQIRVDHLVLNNAPYLNAHAVRNEAGLSAVVITARMLEYVGDDVDALAGLMGHEIGHLALNHREAKKSDPRAQEDAMAFSRHLERKADEFAIRVAFAAGYDPEGLLRWNRRMQQRSSRARYSDTHPPLAEREADNFRLVSELVAAGRQSKEVRLWSLIGLGLARTPEGLTVTRLGAGSSGNLMVGDRIVALEAPAEGPISDIGDVLKAVSPGGDGQSFRFSVLRRDSKMRAYFHSRKRP